MTLTTEEREVLKLAREKIEDGSIHHICNALLNTTLMKPSLHPAAVRLCLYISEQLRYSGLIPALEKWQIYNGFGDRGREQVRLDRLAWIDWMLNEMQES